MSSPSQRRPPLKHSSSLSRNPGNPPFTSSFPSTSSGNVYQRKSLAERDRTSEPDDERRDAMIEHDEPDPIASERPTDRTRRQAPPEANNPANGNGRSGLGNESVDEHRQSSTRSPADGRDAYIGTSQSKLGPELNQNCVSSDNVLALLVCPICPSGALLQRPTTLRCGHSICQSHILGSDDSPVSRPLATHSTPSTQAQQSSRSSVPLTITTSSSSTSSSSPPSPTARTRPPPSPVSRVQAFDCPIASCNDPLSSNRRMHPTVELIISSAAQSSNATNSNSSHRNRNTARGGSSSPNSGSSASEQRQSTPIDVRLSQILSLAREFSPHFNSPGRSIPFQARQGAPHARDTSTTSRSNSSTPPQAFSSSSHPSQPIHLAYPPPVSEDRETRSSRAAEPTSHPNHQDHREEDCTFTDRLLELLNCEVCLNPLRDPVTTPCQHTFCSQCLQRTLDHSPNCPLCRYQLPNIAQYQIHGTNKPLVAIVNSLAIKSPPPTPMDDLPDEEAELDTPIFVCQLSYPGMPTVLHIFEPRYRLMLRRVLREPKPRFGMIMYPSSEGMTVNYGTMLEIRKVRILVDGRSIVETWGTSRFRIIKRGYRDGYLVGKIETIQDLPEAMEREIERNAILHIPPRTPPILPTTSINPIPMRGHQSIPSLHHRRSNSPTPSMASVSTISSTHSNTGAAQVNNLPPAIPRLTPSSSNSGLRQSSPLPTPPVTSTSAGTGIMGVPHHLPSTIVPAPSAPIVPVVRTTQAGFNYPTEPSTEELLATCRAFIDRLRSNSSAVVVQRLNTVGPMPTDKALVAFWIAQLLPIEESEKAKLLPIRSPRLRLRLVVHWIDQFNSAWYFSGCVIA